MMRAAPSRLRRPRFAIRRRTWPATCSSARLILPAPRRENLNAATETLSSKVNAASDAAKEAFDTTRAKAAETFTAARSSAETVVRDNAVLVGGLGLAIGALIAASLPSTRIEQTTLGDTSDALRKTRRRRRVGKVRRGEDGGDVGCGDGR